MRKEFEKELTKQDFLFQETTDGYYNITPRNRIVLPTLVQLVISKPINLTYHGSQNGNSIDAIGYYHFSLNSEHNPEYLVFALLHLRNESIEYMIVPTIELRKRLENNPIRFRKGKYVELRLWLIDNNLYDTTNFGIEAEWFYISAGTGGRMIDGTIWNYTRFLNNWVLESQD